ncbi:DHH family phosphoesterase, partial [Vibrio parahaemolyticus]|nr:DHH family phosphoesterase [Vibrio parahaemolyticus]
MDSAQEVTATHESDTLMLFELPYTAASRLICGVYGNLLAYKYPESGHSVLTENADVSYTVSLRA